MSRFGYRPHDDAPAVQFTQASVHTGRIEIPYRRAGTGASVVVLGAGDELQAVVCRILAHRFRVIVPHLENDGIGVDLGDLFRDFVDGLGLVRPHLVVAGSHGIDALALALSDPHRIDRLAILWPGSSDCTALDRDLEDTLHHSNHPLLLVPFEYSRASSRPDPAQFGTLVSFLGGRSGPSC